MGKSKAAKSQVADYVLSLHLGICHGPVDAVEEVFIGEKKVWSGSQTASGEVVLSDPNLFGGLSKEGGIAGIMRFMFGESTQTIPEYIAAKFSRTTATMPAYRGILSLFFSGESSGGFKWASNSPYVKPVWVKARRKPQGLNAAKAMIGPDANGANIVYECFVNDDWGVGMPSTAIDTASFLYAQDVLFNENFGLSIMWTQSSKVESFVGDVLSHVNGMVYLDPKTGLVKMKLIRDDTAEIDIMELNGDNCEFKNPQHKTWSETINEIVLTWTNPENEQEETMTFQDLANISAQGGTVSDARNYFGIRNKDLATAVGARDIRQTAVPLFSVDAYCDRSAWKISPGDVVKIVSPEDGISQLNMRVMNVTNGRPKNSKIKLSLLQDIFSLQSAQYVSPPGSGWVDSSAPPEPFTAARLMTPPYHWYEDLVGTTEAAATEFPESAVMSLAPLENSDTFSYFLYADTLQPNGSYAYQQAASLTPVGSAVLTSALLFEATSTDVLLSSVLANTAPQGSTFFVIGNTSTPEELCEIAIVMSTGLGGYVLRRGLYDTIPRAWPAGTQVMFFEADDSLFDPSTYSVGQTVNYKLLSRTSQGTLGLSAAPVQSYSPNDRLVAPIRPANITVNGSGYAPTEIPAIQTLVPVTWASRNRASESAPPQAWTDATTAPEVGQTTTVRIETVTGSFVMEHAGLTGTSFDIPVTSFGTLARAVVRVLSVRDSVESFQSHAITVEFPERLGYGRQYGKNYGG